MKRLVFGSFVVLGLVLLLIAPASAQAPGTPPAPTEQMWHFGVPDAAHASAVPAAPGAGWRLANVGGFGTRNNYAVSALELYGGQLFAGTTNDSGGQIWASNNGSTWTQVTLSGFGSASPGSDSIIFDMIEFNGWLYAGTGHWVGSGIAGQIYRTSNGTLWTRVTGGWESNTNNGGITNFAVFGNMLYATTFNPVNGTQVWRSATGNSNDWQIAGSNGFGGGAVYQQVTGMTVFNGFLYAAVESQSATTPLQVWRTSDGTTWLPSTTNGFGSATNYQSGGFAIFNGYLYLGTRNDGTGGQLYRTQNGTAWSPVETNGFGTANNYKVEGLVTYVNAVYAFTDNKATGTQVWSSTDGVAFTQVNNDGFGTNSNVAVALWSNGAANLAGHLYLSTWNSNGGQVWTYLQQNKTYLPAIFK